MIRIGSLFSGIGGLELGLLAAFAEAGIPARTTWQVEREPFPRAVLAKHFPHADRTVTDVCQAGSANLLPVDLICGGFPCQDLSYAGKGAGLAGERSGLWREYARIVRELRPRVVVVENVSALLARGLGDVLGDLAEAGYDARWRCIRAADVGAPHLRERLFIVAYARGEQSRDTTIGLCKRPGAPTIGADGSTLADAHGARLGGVRVGGIPQDVGAQPGDDVDGCRCPWAMGDAASPRCGGNARGGESRERGPTSGPCCSDRRGEWLAQPGVGRATSRLPRGVDGCRNACEAQNESEPKEAANRLMGYGTQGNSGRCEGVRDLRICTGAKEVRRAPRRSGRVRATEVLQSDMLGCGVDDRESDTRRAAKEGREVQGPDVRDVRNRCSATGSPCGQEPGEQRGDEFDDALRLVSHEVALGARQDGASGESDVFRLRTNGQDQDGPVRDALSTGEAFALPERWPSGPGEAQAAWEAPRTARGVNARAARLKALGNAVVPAVAREVGRWMIAEGLLS